MDSATTYANLPYEKCKECHLFIEPNYIVGDTDYILAEYVHLHRGDREDSELDESHEARPSGIVHTLKWWMDNGPSEMRARFDIEKGKE